MTPEDEEMQRRLASFTNASLAKMGYGPGQMHTFAGPALKVAVHAMLDRLFPAFDVKANFEVEVESDPDKIKRGVLSYWIIPTTDLGRRLMAEFQEYADRLRGGSE